MRLLRKTKKVSGWMALSFHEDAIHIAHVIRSQGGKPSIELVHTFPVEKQSLSIVLDKVAKELQVQRYEWTTVLGYGDYQLLSVDAPNVPREELKTAIRWRLKDLLDFHVDDATIDVLDVPVEKNAATRNHSMYVVAAKNQIIQTRQALFADAKIPLSVIDVPEMAQRNVSAMLEPDGRGVAFLAFDATGGLLTVSFAGELYLSRRIDVSFGQLNESTQGEQNPYFERVTLELQRSLDHFDRQYHFITISKLVLLPFGAASVSLQAYLAANLYIAVEALDLESIMDISKIPELKNDEVQSRYFVAIGAALRHEEKVL